MYVDGANTIMNISFDQMLQKIVLKNRVDELLEVCCPVHVELYIEVYHASVSFMKVKQCDKSMLVVEMSGKNGCVKCLKNTDTIIIQKI